jgi:uncharacterized phage protein (TIGR01671 family)
MREIKFRVWDSDNAVMAFSEESDQDAYAWGFENGDMKCWSLLDMEATVDEPAHREALELDGDTMQFTGLKDKNGKEIYEGDMIKFHHFWFDGLGESEEEHDCIIKWEDNYAAFLAFTFKGEDLFHYFLHECSDDGIEVIGNIYDNPELLKAKP